MNKEKLNKWKSSPYGMAALFQELMLLEEATKESLLKTSQEEREAITKFCEEHNITPGQLFFAMSQDENFNQED